MTRYLGRHLVSVENRREKLALLKNTEFMTCNKCKYEKMIVRYSRRGQLFSGCEGFPYCRNTMNLPIGITYLEMLNHKCKNWELKGRGSVKTFKLQFFPPFAENPAISEILGGKDNAEFCIYKGCDPKLTKLVTLWRRVNTTLE